MCVCVEKRAKQRRRRVSCPAVRLTSFVLKGERGEDGGKAALDSLQLHWVGGGDDNLEGA